MPWLDYVLAKIEMEMLLLEVQHPCTWRSYLFRTCFSPKTMEEKLLGVAERAYSGDICFCVSHTIASFM